MIPTTDIVSIPDDVKGTIWMEPMSGYLFIRYIVHWGEYACSFQNEADPDFCPAMEYNFVYIGEL